MRGRAIWGVMVGTLLLLSACSTAQNGSGWVAMAHFTDREQGLSGLEPVIWTDQAALLQQSVPGTMQEIAPILLAQTSLDEFPEKVGSYSGTALSWDLYAFEAQIHEIGTETYHIDLALSGGDSSTYMVALIAPPEDYAAHESLYRTVYRHALHALAPLE